MASLVANGNQFPPFSDSFVGGANAPSGNAKWYADGNYGDDPFETEPQYREVDCEYVGVFDGVGTNRMLFLGRMIFATLLFTGTEAQCRSQWASVHASLTQLARYTVALPNGASYDGCKLVNFERPRFAQKAYQGGIMVLAVPVTLRQKSLTN